jgi:UPF0755 protein
LYKIIICIKYKGPLGGNVQDQEGNGEGGINSGLGIRDSEKGKGKEVVMAGKKKKFWIWMGGIAALIVIAAVSVFIWIYSWIYSPSLVNTPDEKAYLYIRTGSVYDDVKHDLDSLGWHKNMKSFDWVARKKEYPSKVKPGRYELFRGMSNDSLVNLLRSGKQSEIELVFNTMRTLEYLASVVSNQIEADSVSLISIFRDTSLMENLGFTPESWMGIFIPNTYRFFWNTNATQFINRMKKEYEDFWSGQRDSKREEMGFSRNEVMALAAIVQSETFKLDEMPRVAGVYMNRLKKGMKLQADPTVIYAIGDYNMRRVLRKHLRVDSPYNTYKYAGLPPGPIRIPSLQAIDACLNYEQNDYLYFCAKDDFSGYHSFASSYMQHLRNARKYQKALNERQIFE